MTTTHDYTKATWGRDYAVMKVFDGGRLLRLTGWGRGISSGDYMILRNGIATTRYCVDHIEYRSDPSDMWFADVTFAPRSALEDES